MKVKKLTPAERALLADLVESDYWKTIVKVLANTQTDLAENAPWASNMEVLAEIRGKVSFIREFETFLRKNHKDNRPPTPK